MGNGMGSIPYIASGHQTILLDKNILLMLVISQVRLSKGKKSPLEKFKLGKVPGYVPFWDLYLRKRNGLMTNQRFT